MILYLHIPHTGGRVLRIYLWANGYIDTKVRYVHGTPGITRMLKNGEENSIYFVLRNPVERIIGEFLHYSDLLKKHGMVGHLWLHKIEEKFPDFDPTDPYQYIKVESGHNLCCKYLLLRTDFNLPITDDDFSSLKEKLNDMKFDLYETPLTHPVLAEMLNIDKNILIEGLENTPIQSLVIPDKKYKESLLSNLYLINKIEEYNTYDIKLFNLLTKQK